MQVGERKERRLIDKGKKGLIRVIFSRTGVVLFLFLLGVMLFVAILLKFAEWLPHFVGAVVILQIAVIVELFNNNISATAKNTWFLVVCVLPIIGPLFYIYTLTDPGSRHLKKTFLGRQKRDRDILPEDQRVLRELEVKAPGVAALCKYVAGTGNFPVFDGTRVDYYELGEYKWAAMLEDLEKAEEFIFLEYFIIDEGKMWGQVLEILARKAQEGLDVRVMYDGTCEFFTLPHDYPERLRALDIRCHVFAQMTPFLSTVYNNRDHRKILVIDGKVAYNGGVNLADEYINEKERFGHWKDTAVRIEGPAVDSFTMMFLELWCIEDEPNESARFMRKHSLLPLRTAGPDAVSGSQNIAASGARDDAASGVLDEGAAAAWYNGASGTQGDAAASSYGYVMPYADNPMDGERVGENVYLDFLYRANEYVHIMSPYLILDDELLTALTVTARKGIDVQLILPGIPDKKMVYILAKSYFARLLEAGVKIYTYTPGFVHAKVFVSDECKATVGTINLDYRSLCHHFECGTFLYNVPCISEIEWDFLETREKCRRVTMEDVKGEKLFVRAFGAVLRMIAPLL